MSHVTTIKTRLVQREATIQAFNDLGYEVDDRLQVKLKNGYRIGLVEGDGGYALVADWSMCGVSEGSLVPKLQQRYAYHVTCQQLESQGFSLVEEHQEDGKIHLLLRRMA